MIVVKTVYELEPRISSCIVKKTGCQASRLGSERTELVDSVADRLRAEPPRGAGIGRASPVFCLVL